MNKSLLNLRTVDHDISLKEASWSFSLEGLAEKFSSHIQKSIPSYLEGHKLILELSDFFARSETTVYDLGCSIGSLTRQLAERHGQKGINFVGIDKEKGMIEEAIRKSGNKINLKFICEDFLKQELSKTSFVVFYYTLQFMPFKDRLKALKKTQSILENGGACVVFEKVLEKTPSQQDMISFLYRNYKRKQGFSADEILAKESSLRGVLCPQTQKENFCLFEKAGFSEQALIMKNLCFEGYLLKK